MICSQNLSARSTDNKKISLIEWDYSQFSGEKNQLFIILCTQQVS